jgi:bacillolysin
LTKLRALILCASVLSIAAPWPDLTARTAPSAGFQVTAQRVEDLRIWDRFIETERAAGAMRLRSARFDPDLPGRLVERLDQVHDGVPIWGGQVVRHSDRGVPQWIFGSITNAPEVDVEPQLTSAAARSALLNAAAADLITPPQLVILPLARGGVALAYHAVARTEDVARIFVDANTGSELWRFSELRSQSSVGSGQGVLGDTKKLSVERQAGVYVTSDTHRPPVIETYDMAGNLNRAKQVLFGGALSASELASDADNVWTDQAVVDAHAHIGWTYDYFFKRFGRHGLDDRDRPMLALVNPVTQQGALTLPSADLGLFVVNAFWCPPCGPNQVGMMLFGNGIPPNFSLGNQTYTYLAGALDVVAHELTHAVTSNTSDLIASNEPAR